MFTLLTRLFRRQPLPQPQPPRHAADTADDIPRGCGWFDSSHDLLTGVTVWEGIIVVDNTVATPS